MIVVLLSTLFALSIFAIGVLVGNGMNTRTQETRDRRQAATQRRLNERARALTTGQRTGRPTIDYEITNEAPRGPARRGSY